MYLWHILDPQIKEDVQRALKAKALRKSRSRPEAIMSVPQTLTVDSSRARLSEDVTTRTEAATLPYTVTPPKPVISVSTRLSSSLKSTHGKITFPSHVHSPAHSLESISSYGSQRRTPLPHMVTSQDGYAYLDWSGAFFFNTGHE